MKLYSIILFNNNNEIISEAYNLSYFGFFERTTIKEFIIFFTNLTSTRITSNTKNTIKHSIYVIYCYKNNNNTCCIVCDEEYPEQPAFYIINEILQKQFSTPELQKLIIKYEDPNETNKIYKIQGELSNIKNVLNQTIDSLLERGEKLEDIVEKSNNLSNLSKDFYKKTKENNCCFAS
jgi:synaptobrevin family protein YKT6